MPRHDRAYSVHHSSRQKSGGQRRKKKVSTGKKGIIGSRYRMKQG